MNTNMAAAAIAAVILQAAPASGDDEAMSRNADIRAALENRTAFEAGKDYRPWRQFFGSDGSTLYFNEGPASAGRWEIRDGRYCSVWPPAEQWFCYEVELSPAKPPHDFIVWIGPDGERTSAHLRDGDRTAERDLPKR
jgi:hypothetical protein